MINQLTIQSGKEKDLMYAVSLQSYGKKLKMLYEKECNYTKKDFEELKEIVKNVTY